MSLSGGGGSCSACCAEYRVLYGPPVGSDSVLVGLVFALVVLVIGAAALSLGAGRWRSATRCRPVARRRPPSALSLARLRAGGFTRDRQCRREQHLLAPRSAR